MFRLAQTCLQKQIDTAQEWGCRFEFTLQIRVAFVSRRRLTNNKTFIYISTFSPCFSCIFGGSFLQHHPTISSIIRHHPRLSTEIRWSTMNPPMLRLVDNALELWMVPCELGHCLYARRGPRAPRSERSSAPLALKLRMIKSAHPRWGNVWSCSSHVTSSLV